MKSVYVLILIFFFGGGFESSSCKQTVNNIKIIPFDVLNETDTFTDKNKIFVTRQEFFLVETKENDTSKIYQQIKSFVNSNCSTNVQNYSYYELVFYKTDNPFDQKKYMYEPKLIRKQLFRNGDPTIMSFTWDTKGFTIINKFINGKIINNSTSKVTSITIDSIKN